MGTEKTTVTLFETQRVHLFNVNGYPVIGILLGCLVLFMIADILMGFLVAKNNLKVNSAVSFRGLSKKAGVLILITLGLVLQGILMLLFNKTLPIPVAEVITTFYIWWEGMSITENAAILGLPIPKGWMAILEKVREYAEGEVQRVEVVQRTGSSLNVRQSEPVPIRPAMDLPVEIKGADTVVPVRNVEETPPC